tara:strand:+ start:349 stop:588 length:240 start_codon:yes stop_codon:yes gene_type:complete
MKPALLLLPLLLASCAVDHSSDPPSTPPTDEYFDEYAGDDGDPDLWDFSHPPLSLRPDGFVKAQPVDPWLIPHLMLEED